MKFNSIFTTNKKKDYAYKVRQLNGSSKKLVLDNVGVFKYLDRWWDSFIYNLEVEVEDFIKYAKYHAEHPEVDKLQLHNWWDRIISADYYNKNIGTFFDEHYTKDAFDILIDKGLLPTAIGIYLPRTPVGRINTWEKKDVIDYYEIMRSYYEEFKQSYLNVVNAINEV